MTTPPSAVVTGASRGLGGELCSVLLRRGWRVFPVLRRPEALARFAAAPAARCHPVVADLASDDAIETVHQAVRAHADALDVLVNNAGAPGAGTRLATVSPAEIAALVDVHCLAAVRATRAVLPLLLARPASRVVNVSSRVGSLERNAAGAFAGEPLSYSYRIAKAAQNMLTLCMSQELGPQGVVVCALHPGEFRSDLNPEGEESASSAAERIATWLGPLDAGAHGRWHDPRVGVLPW
jgi:NAD(P)-dependent dehydrogenase (short-subunit alcohol dehydrogenase family)